MILSARHAGRERRRAKPSPAAIALAALGLLAVAFATLCPPDLRPHLADANLERLGAYFVLGGLFAFAAGRRVIAATAAIVLLAVALEAAQRLVPGRHGQIADAAVKALGGDLGVAAAQLRYPLLRLAARLGARLSRALRPRRPAPAYR